LESFLQRKIVLPGQMSRGIMMFGMFYPAATPFLLRLPAFKKINRDFLFAPSENVAMYILFILAGKTFLEINIAMTDV
jgi:hypothetical protein